MLYSCTQRPTRIAAAIVPAPTPLSIPNSYIDINELIITRVISKQFLTVLNLVLAAKAIAITMPSPDATNILAYTHKKMPRASITVPRRQ